MIISDISKINNKQKDRIIITCDFKASTNCKIRWETSYASCLKTRLKRSGKDCCNKCASKISNSGNLNPSFKYEKNENFFENIDNEAKAYLLGWIASDGSIRDRTLHMELNVKDIKILKLFKNQLSKNCPIVKRKRSDNWYITISSVKLINDICNQLNVNTGNKQNKVRLPLFKNNLLSAFIRGFLEGDGWITYRNNKIGIKSGLRCGIATICPNLKLDLYNLSKKLNINCYVGKRGIEWVSKKSVLTILDFIYDNSNYYLDRKYNKYIKWKKINV